MAMRRRAGPKNKKEIELVSRVTEINGRCRHCDSLGSGWLYSV